MMFTLRSLIVWRLCVLFLLVGLSSQATAMQWHQWTTVGQAELKWGFWTIYDSELRTPTGQYQAEQDDLALVIQYRRNISCDALLEATDKQWRHLGISPAQRHKWLTRLKAIWPDVRKGDRLVFELTQGTGRFYLDKQLIGEITDIEMNQAFASIWLSADTAYPRVRRALIGGWS